MTENARASAGRLSRTVPQHLPVEFAAFHEHHRPVYIRYAERRLCSRADAEEAVDDAFEQLARSWPEILAGENPAAYAWQVVSNRVTDCARARRRRTSLADTMAFETLALRNSPSPIEELESNLCLFQAVTRLAQRQQDVFVLLHCEGYSTAEVAAHLGITEAGVRSTDRYAKRRLRELLAPPADREEER